jgi:hypothetical protein
MIRRDTVMAFTLLSAFILSLNAAGDIRLSKTVLTKTVAELVAVMPSTWELHLKQGSCPSGYEDSGHKGYSITMNPPYQPTMTYSKVDVQRSFQGIVLIIMPVNYPGRRNKVPFSTRSGPQQSISAEFMGRNQQIKVYIEMIDQCDSWPNIRRCIEKVLKLEYKE